MVQKKVFFYLILKLKFIILKLKSFHSLRLPRYASKFLEMCLMITADHGPAVSGAHNTIVCTRAGKDLISSLVSGLLTIVIKIVL
jgi:citrate synthase